jgi:HD-GYP domain-containing protein (c-di-GMP phosphodiesterase class II)
MLKRIDPTQARIGMFIHKLEGSWFSHPFWKSRFLLTDAVRLEQLHNSDLTGIVIDTEKGRDVDGTLPATPAPTIKSRWRRAPEPDVVQPTGLPGGGGAMAALKARLGLLTPSTIQQEFHRAEQVAEHGARVVSRVFLDMRLRKTVQPELVQPVIEDIFASVQRNPHAFDGLMRCKRDIEYLYRHALATSALMVALGCALKLHPVQVHQAGTVGLLLDTGLGMLPVNLADYGGDPHLIPANIQREHVQYSHDFILGSNFAPEVARAVYEHHERMDGTGYPQGLKGADLSLLGRMAAVCDSFDDLVNDLDGSTGLDPASALEEMKADHGAYDADILAALEQALGIYPVGSVVALRTGRLAMVVDQNVHEPASPRVRTFYSLHLRRQIAPEVIDLAHCFGADSIDRHVDVEALDVPDLGKMRLRMLATSCAS